MFHRDYSPLFLTGLFIICGNLFWSFSGVSEISNSSFNEVLSRIYSGNSSKNYSKKSFRNYFVNSSGSCSRNFGFWRPPIANWFNWKIFWTSFRFFFKSFFFQVFQNTHLRIHHEVLKIFQNCLENNSRNKSSLFWVSPLTILGCRKLIIFYWFLQELTFKLVPRWLDVLKGIYLDLHLGIHFFPNKFLLKYFSKLFRKLLQTFM